MTSVLDASAILAWLQEEPGADVVDDHLFNGIVSSVNWSEVLQKTQQHDRDAYETAALLEALGVSVADATKEDGELAAALWDTARPLSLADRFCLALGTRLRSRVVTAERAWANVVPGAEVTVIR